MSWQTVKTMFHLDDVIDIWNADNSYCVSIKKFFMENKFCAKQKWNSHSNAFNDLWFRVQTKLLDKFHVCQLLVANALCLDTIPHLTNQFGNSPNKQINKSFVMRI